MNTPAFTPSSSLLLSMIEAAMAKCDKDVAEHRAERAFAHNAREIRKSREHNCRRYVYAGDRP